MREKPDRSLHEDAHRARYGRQDVNRDSGVVTIAGGLSWHQWLCHMRATGEKHSTLITLYNHGFKPADAKKMLGRCYRKMGTKGPISRSLLFAAIL